MNTLFNTALKQSTALKRDLSAAPSAALTPSHLGQISAALTSFNRTLDAYSDLTRQELDEAKRTKAQDRLAAFRADLAAFRDQYRDLQRLADDTQTSLNRAELLGRRPHHAATPENPYSNAAIASSAASVTSSPWAPPSAAGGAGGGGGGAGGRGLAMGTHRDDDLRETHALREQTFFSNTHTALDEYLARGQAVLGDLGQQREMLKGTQKRLYSVANTLGVSGETIRMVERRARQDKWIFGVGVVVFFGFCWAVLHFLR